MSDLPNLLKLLIAMVFVLGLMGGLALIVRRLGLSHLPVAPKSTAQKRLQIVESMPIDVRRRLVLIQRDDVQHLVIIGAQDETVIETNIVPPAPAKKDSAKKEG